MSLQLNWVGEEAYDRIALTRLRCYAGSVGKLDRFQDSVRHDPRQKPGDFLLATRDGPQDAVDVGTTTALSLKMWIRGARLDCQGVAYVGTIKTHRRGGSDGERGIASQLMDATIRRAREREQPITALMPFRASFYEHFGYGNAEHRVDWTVPLAILPRGDFSGYRFYESDDTAILKLRELEARAGQCDVETDAAALSQYQKTWPEGMTFVDQPTPGGPIEAYTHVREERLPHTATLIVEDWGTTSRAALVRMLHLFGSLKDQYSSVRLTLPADVPLNRLLRESQMPHRQVDHPVAASKPYTRMQVRILDHRKVLESMTLPTTEAGNITVAIRESENTITRLSFDVDAGRIAMRNASGEPDVTLSDVMWASIVTGDISATTAQSFGLIKCDSSETLALLDAFAIGPKPFCQEYF